jgi:hypothetical protein
MAWPERGVYFFFEQGETRSKSHIAERVVRVGTHALTTSSQTTLHPYYRSTPPVAHRRASRSGNCLIS